MIEDMIERGFRLIINVVQIIIVIIILNSGIDTFSSDYVVCCAIGLEFHYLNLNLFIKKFV